MFKVGDRVRCVEQDQRTPLLLSEGSVYTVSKADPDDTIMVDAIDYWWQARRFVLADEQPATVRYATGAVRSADAESVRYDLISPIALERWAKTCHEGAIKYGDANWEKGMAVSVMLNHAVRHVYKYLAGDRSEDHLGHAMWNIAGAIHSETLWPHLNHNLRGPNCTPPTEAVKP